MCSLLLITVFIAFWKVTASHIKKWSTSKTQIWHKIRESILGKGLILFRDIFKTARDVLVCQTSYIKLVKKIFFWLPPVTQIKSELRPILILQIVPNLCSLCEMVNLAEAYLMSWAPTFV